MKLLPLLFILVVSAACTTNYYIVRHADRADNSADSPLSPNGFTRAATLRDTLIEKKVDSLFASTFIRAQQTALPLANALSKSIRIYNKDTTDGLIAVLKKINGKNILVVGHTDNVPAIVLGISNQAIPAISHDDYDNLYIVKVRKCLTTKRSLRHKTYGVPSP